MIIQALTNLSGIFGCDYNEGQGLNSQLKYLDVNKLRDEGSEILITFIQLASTHTALKGMVQGKHHVQRFSDDFWVPQPSCSMVFDFFFIFITTPEGHVRVHFANLNLISVRHRKYRLIILLYLHLLSCSSTLDLLFFSGSGASTLARELEPPRP